MEIFYILEEYIIKQNVSVCVASPLTFFFFFEAVLHYVALAVLELAV